MDTLITIKREHILLQIYLNKKKAEFMVIKHLQFQKEIVIVISFFF